MKGAKTPKGAAAATSSGEEGSDAEEPKAKIKRTKTAPPKKMLHFQERRGGQPTLGQSVRSIIAAKEKERRELAAQMAKDKATAEEKRLRHSEAAKKSAETRKARLAQQAAAALARVNQHLLKCHNSSADNLHGLRLLPADNLESELESFKADLTAAKHGGADAAPAGDEGHILAVTGSATNSNGEMLYQVCPLLILCSRFWPRCSGTGLRCPQHPGNVLQTLGLQHSHSSTASMRRWHRNPRRHWRLPAPSFSIPPPHLQQPLP